MALATCKEVYRPIFDFWLKVFAVSFGMGVVSGIVMAFQFGTNWSVMAERTGSIQGPLLGYETFTAFLLEASFFGVMMFGRDRVSPKFYLFSCCMVAVGAMASSFWILANNSWMQVPVGHEIVDGKIIPSDWLAIIWGPVFKIRWLHMLLGAFLTTAMCVAATGAWYHLRRVHIAEGRVMLHWGLALAALLIPLQLFLGHLNGKYVYEHQPAKFAAIEARWTPQQPGTEVWLARPDEAEKKNLFAIETPGVGSSIATGTWTAAVPGLRACPKSFRGLSSTCDRPPARSRAQPDAGAWGKLGDKAGADHKPTGGELGTLRGPHGPAGCQDHEMSRKLFGQALSDFPEEDWPPVAIPFFTFRIMVGMGLAMLAISWFGNLPCFTGKLETARWFLQPTFLAFPTGFVGVIAGWYTAEVGRQPWVVYGLLRTADANTPSLTADDALTTMIGYAVVYAIIYSFGIYYIFKLLRQGRTAPGPAPDMATAKRPMAAAGSARTATGGDLRLEE